MISLWSVLAVPDPTQTHHWLLPETAEIIYGGIASVLVFALLIKLAGPMAKKALAGRTEKIQNEMDSAKAVRSDAEVEAGRIRTALGDISAERARILAEADAQATSALLEGRARIVTEMAELEAKAVADIATAFSRVGDELRAEITRLSVTAIERVVATVIDDKARQEMIESFISSVGATR